jgi:hypothetical protein
MSPHPNGRRSGTGRQPGGVQLLALLTVVVIGAAVAGCGANAVRRSTTVGDVHPSITTAATAPTATPAAPATRTAALRPTELLIPAIGVATSVVSLGLNPDQTVQVPSDPSKAGWYRFGPTPGAPGSAVILGHVDSLSGPAVFYRLRTLSRGAQITFVRSDGTRTRFVVRSVTTYPNDRFPAAAVYRNHGTPTLTLVTCGGGYDKAKGGYQANVVVSAAYVGPAPASTVGLSP